MIDALLALGACRVSAALVLHARVVLNLAAGALDLLAGASCCACRQDAVFVRAAVRIRPAYLLLRFLLAGVAVAGLPLRAVAVKAAGVVAYALPIRAYLAVLACRLAHLRHAFAVLAYITSEAVAVINAGSHRTARA